VLRIRFGEDDKWHGKPLYEAIVEKCPDRPPAEPHKHWRLRATDRHEYFYPDDLEHVIRETRDKFVSGLALESEARFRGKDWKYRWFLLR
jgi:hypothetical protein